MALLAVEEALSMVLAAARPMPSERVDLMGALGRVTASPLSALRTQPPFDASAMDGYAMRAQDLHTGEPLQVIGESVAGQAFTGTLKPKQAVRIFTGAPVPEGADTIVLQEHVTRSDNQIIPTTDKDRLRHIRKAGLDFTTGDPLISQGSVLSPAQIALAAAMGHVTIPVACRPKVAILANGDELVAPGEPCGPDQIIASNQLAIASMTLQAGGEPLPLGIAPDDLEKLSASVQSAINQKADLLITLGGASVGDRDLIRQVLEQQGMTLGFWKIAMRPGKPLIFGSIGSMLVLGLPGNPVSSIICAKLFMVPLIKHMLGLPAPDGDGTEPAILGSDLPENDLRQDYLRARLSRDPATDQWVATPFTQQDSSMLRVMSQAQGLILRKPFAPKASQGDLCRILPL